MKKNDVLLALFAIIVVGFPRAFAQVPVTYVHRAEAIMMLLKSAGVEVDKQAKTFNAYPDVIDGEWYVPYMMAGLKRGMIEVETSTGMLRPHASVTRAEFLKMLTKAFGLTTNIPYEYSDIPKGAWYATYVGLSAKYNLFPNAKNPNLLQPDLRVSHEQVSRAVFTLLSKEPHLQPTPGQIPVATPQKPQTDIIDTVATNIQETTREVAQTYITLMTPQSVKAAMLKLLQTRTNLADQTRLQLIEAVNVERAKYRLPTLRSNYYLEMAAQNHAKDMYDRGYFSHFTPEGLSYVDRIRNSGYLEPTGGQCSCTQKFDIASTQKGPNYVLTQNETCTCEPNFSLGENLAKGQLSVEQVMQDWMNSPHHRENILRPEFEEIGIGLFGDVWAQAFGKLRFP